MSATVGSLAPSFSLTDQDRNTVTLDDLKGTKTLIVFIPFPFTGICDDESCAIRDQLATLNGLDANVVVITCHAVPVAKKWSDENGFTFPVLSDFWPHGAVATAYGAFNGAVGGANRMTFVLDADGIVRTVIDSGALSIGREFDEYVTALGEIG
ncbi:MAG: redoxin domain-containing protein [Actinomycetota bacterium]|nr:redoxin domain-containing protein [Actinomycetota bacterium]